MGMFKIGDRVRRISDKQCVTKPSHKKGFEFTIGFVEEFTVVEAPVDGELMGLSAHNMRHIELV